MTRTRACPRLGAAPYMRAAIATIETWHCPAYAAGRNTQPSSSQYALLWEARSMDMRAILPYTSVRWCPAPERRDPNARMAPRRSRTPPRAPGAPPIHLPGLDKRTRRIRARRPAWSRATQSPYCLAWRSLATDLSFMHVCARARIQLLHAHHAKHARMLARAHAHARMRTDSSY